MSYLPSSGVPLNAAVAIVRSNAGRPPPYSATRSTLGAQFEAFILARGYTKSSTPAPKSQGF